MHVGTLDFKCSLLFLDEVTHSLNLDLSCKRWTSLDLVVLFLILYLPQTLLVVFDVSVKSLGIVLGLTNNFFKISTDC